jgi:(R)-2-hydroxyacyl-CoA dehydratese activating ATPase
MAKKYTVGIDIGSVAAKGVLLADGRVLRTENCSTGYNVEAVARALFERLLKAEGLDEGAVQGIVSTGYGRNTVSFARKAFTEILCHGTGARFLNTEVRAVIDIGGQDSKVILLNGEGKVANFVMNDKCAAGTGRFLEVMARALEVDLERFGEMSLLADRPAPISNLCTVFAESEVVSLIAKGEKRENIIAGIHEAIGSRVGAMAVRAGLGTAPLLMMTGGVARNAGVVKVLEKILGCPVQVSPMAQMTGAIGAACLAAAMEDS